jgi:sacsin
MIQNADDAGATVVKFYVDCRQHGTSGLVKQELKDYQGPALISANDAVFSEEDWEGIQSLQQSIKADDPFKVGRFGIGFNSVYHLTGKVELP